MIVQQTFIYFLFFQIIVNASMNLLVYKAEYTHIHVEKYIYPKWAFHELSTSRLNYGFD